MPYRILYLHWVFCDIASAPLVLSLFGTPYNIDVKKPSVSVEVYGPFITKEIRSNRNYILIWYKEKLDTYCGKLYLICILNWIKKCTNYLAYIIARTHPNFLRTRSFFTRTFKVCVVFCNYCTSFDLNFKRKK